MSTKNYLGSDEAELIVETLKGELADKRDDFDIADESATVAKRDLIQIQAPLIVEDDDTLGSEKTVVSFQAGAQLDLDDFDFPSGNMEGHHYSTNEQIVGTWIDGKPLYEKTIDFGTLPSTNTKTVSHGVLNWDIIFVYNAFSIHKETNNNYSDPIPFAHPSTASSMIAIEIQDSNVFIRTGQNFNNNFAYITLRYTKTTDSAQS